MLCKFFSSDTLRSTWNGQLLAVHNWNLFEILDKIRRFTFCDVEIEKVHVKYSLNASSDNSDSVEHAFLSVAVVPVNNVESAKKVRSLVYGSTAYR